MRLYSDAKVHFERNYARLGAFQPSRRRVPRATDFEFYFIFFVCLFDTLRFVRRLIEDRFYSKKPSKRRNLFCLFLEGKNEK